MIPQAQIHLTPWLDLKNFQTMFLYVFRSLKTQKPKSSEGKTEKPQLPSKGSNILFKSLALKNEVLEKKNKTKQSSPVDWFFVPFYPLFEIKFHLGNQNKPNPQKASKSLLPLLPALGLPPLPTAAAYAKLPLWEWETPCHKSIILCWGFPRGPSRWSVRQNC